MGRSLRRIKKGAPKVRVGIVKRSKLQKSDIPREVTEHRPDVEKKLKKQPNWTPEGTLSENYQHNGFILNPNAGAGSKIIEVPLVPKETREAAGEETYSDDDELRAGCNLHRKEEKKKLPKLTTHQKQIVLKLITKHGENFEAMVWDTKLNPMQHSEAKLRQLVAAYKQGEKYHGFRGPNKAPAKKLL